MGGLRELLSRYIKPQWKRLTFGVSIKLIGSMIELLLPYILSYIINKVTPTGDIKKIVLLGFLMILTALTAWAMNVVANRNANLVARNATRKIRLDLFTSTMYLTRAQTDEFTIPSLMSRVTSDSYNVHGMIGMSQRIGIRAPILLIGGLTITFISDPGLALILLALQPIIFITVIAVSKKGLPLFKHLQEQVDKIVLVMRENITGIRIIKALMKTEYERQRFDDTNRELIRREKKSSYTMSVTNPLVTFYMNLGLALVVLVGAFRVRSGHSEVGTIMAFLSYFTMIINSMYAISRIFVVSTRGLASYARISEVINTKPDLEVMNIPKEETDYKIEFRDVSFSYYKNKNNLTDISFKLKEGQTLGIIGPTGSGKSTIIRLLMRLYDVSTGQVLIDGRDVRSIPFEELYTMFGIVFQDDVLFADTIAENIALGRDLSQDDLADSIEMAQASEFVYKFDDKLDHRLTIRGSNLSGGQKQRLLISRALASDPEILILDDSSSALDYTTDQKLRASISENLTKSTSIIIAQRISSIKDSDLIIIMDDGYIAGIGTHEELMQENQHYREISAAQLGV